MGAARNFKENCRLLDVLSAPDSPFETDSSGKLWVGYMFSPTEILPSERLSYFVWRLCRVLQPQRAGEAAPPWSSTGQMVQFARVQFCSKSTVSSV